MVRRIARITLASLVCLIVALALPAAAALADPPVIEQEGPEADEEVYPGPVEAEAEATSPVAAAPGGPALEVKSPSAILMEVLSGKVLFEKNADAKHAPASLTKIMTLLLAIEAIEQGRMSYKDTVVASENAESYGGTEIWLEPGEEMSVEDILMSIAVASANDASVALAEHMCGSEEEFVALMNQRAAELGMTNTHFVNSHGLDAPGHMSTARDFGILSCEASRHPELLRFTAVYETHIRPGGETWLVNRNRMVNFYQGCDGLKTGWTNDAKYSVSVTAQRAGTRFVAVVMGAESPNDRFADTTKMLNWAFANYSSLEVAQEAHPYGAVRVNLGKEREVEAVAAKNEGVLLEKGTEGEVQREVILDQSIDAPVRRGDPVGAIVIRRGEEEIGRVTLVADRDVGRIGYFGLWWRLFCQVIGGK